MLIEPQFRTETGDRIWSAEARVARMAAFEAALAEAQAEAGIIPDGAARAIVAACGASRGDAEAVFAAARDAGNPAIPFVKRLTRDVAAQDAAAARHVHFGATSQDVIDSALMLGLAETCDALAASLAACVARLGALARAHEGTPIAARTLLQQATPITFGLKAALWLVGIERARRRIVGLRREEIAVQFAGATGSGAVLGPAHAAIRAALARRLGLADPGFCWHTLRDRVLDIAAALAGAIAACAKIAGDMTLLMQSEIGEAREAGGAGRGGSSAMPHKRNPVDALAALAALPAAAGHVAALLAAQPHAHERAAGGWHAEWNVMPALATLALGAAASCRDLVAGLEIDAARMSANLALHKGLLASEELASALGERIGRGEAHRLVEELTQRAIASGGAFDALARSEARITAAIDGAALERILRCEAPITAAAAESRRLLARFAPPA